MTTAVIFVIILAMLLLVLGMAGYVALTVVLGAVLDLVRSFPGRSRSEPPGRPPGLPMPRGEIGPDHGPESSVEDLWRRMQGTDDDRQRWWRPRHPS